MTGASKIPVALLAVAAALVLFAPFAWGNTGSTAVFKVGEARYTVDGEEYLMDAAVYVEDGRAFAPFRYAAYACGVTPENILWNPATRTLTLVKGDRVVQVTADSNILVVNGTQIAMDVKAVIKDGRFFLPVRWLAVALDAIVVWDPVSQTITIRSPAGAGKSSKRDETTAQEPATDDRNAIVKEYRWHDRWGNEWTWRVSIPEEMYRYYRNQLRIHERILKEYLERLNSLRQKLEELKRYMDFWYQQCRISSDDSYYEAWRKYQLYVSKYYEAMEELNRIQSEYQNLERWYREARYREMSEGYVPYVTEEGNGRLVRTLAESLAGKAPLDPRERVEFVAAFVQEAIPYVSEEGEYPRYPVETLVEGGDCEDKSILLAALLRTMGYRVALLVFDDNPGHMAVGVECPDCWGSYYLKDGVRYFYLESTAPNWSVGQVPPEYRGRGALVYVVP
ncbi:copper amine oxidase domain protein [Ammonifex degensii KC4]|uniref:Copper amine oxidase domain protein n=1 Tax=Ammonifex degensii (strain DSM 10501 / KC4) TaxID=429009 RepID=C9R817_AMMDK|nr:stalk domain-containing protein [Ammonifex degensii]ACX52446.1 copper amine oxidase domain protein [Ammonifex degensii KC4]